MPQKMPQANLLTELLASGKLADTHAHLDYEIFDGPQLSQLLKRADAAGLAEIWLMSVDADSFNANLDLLQRAATIPHKLKLRLALGFDMELLVPGSDLFTAGLYKLSPVELVEKMSAQLQSLWASAEAAGQTVEIIGEIGLDYYWLAKAYDEGGITRVDVDTSHRLQQELFRLQLEYAGERNLPVSVHSRGAERETLGMLKEWVADYPAAQFVLHSYTGPAETLLQTLALGGKIGLNGIMTYKTAFWLKTLVLEKLSERAKPGEQPTLQDLYDCGFVLETDAPFLIPGNSDRDALKAAYGEAVNDPATVKDLASALGLRPN
jgi:TatD DNase family protein